MTPTDGAPITQPVADRPDQSPEPTTPRWTHLPGRRFFFAIAVGALTVDLLVSHPFGASSTIALVGIGLAALATTKYLDRTTVALLVGATLLAACLAIRATPWLTWLNLIGSFGIVLIALARRPDDANLGVAIGHVIGGRFARRGLMLALPLFGNEVRRELETRTGILQTAADGVRAVAVALPLGIVLVALLASGDALFTSLFDIPFGPVGAVEHTWLLLVGASGMAVLVAAANAHWRAPLWPVAIRAVEPTAVLATFAAIDGIFLLTQVQALLGGSDYVLSRTGLSYAEYARSGFFQLLAAALLTLACVSVIHRHTTHLTGTPRRRIRSLSLITVGATLVMVASSVRRLMLYENEFGLTMLRLFTTVFAVWLGVVFVLLAAQVVGRLRPSLAAAITTSAFVALLFTNAINPELLVAERNLDRFGAAEQLDVAYLMTHLGADAAPALAEHSQTRAAWCANSQYDSDPILTFNLGRWRAANAYAVCETD